MVDGGGGAAFPVIFYDGEREINIGDISVQPMLEFKTFQMMISQRIGISPNQISIYIVHHSSSLEERRKIPITGKVNFSLIIGQKDCFFLVILKRSRKSRNRKSRPNGIDYGDYQSDGEYTPSPPPENVVLLRRNQPDLNMNGPLVNGYAQQTFYEQIAHLELASLNDRLQNLKVQRENYGMVISKPLNFMGPNLSQSEVSKFNQNMDSVSFPRIEETMAKNAKGSSSNKVACVECEKVKKSGGGAEQFHACVNDPIITGFRTRAGPIARPAKPSR